MFFLGFLSFPVFVFLLLFLFNLAESTGTWTPKASNYFVLFVVNSVYRVDQAAQYLVNLVLKREVQDN